MPETIRGTIKRVYHSGPQFSAGLLEADDGRRVRFCGADGGGQRLGEQHRQSRCQGGREESVVR